MAEEALSDWLATMPSAQSLYRHTQQF